MELYLSLGSNLGDRESNLNAALSRLSELLGTAVSKVSSVYITRPWGFESPNMFLNLVARYDIHVPCDEREALRVLRMAKLVEKESGRIINPAGSQNSARQYENRPVDIDILLFGDLLMDTEELSIPHPLMGQRVFVMKPLSDVISDEAKERIPFEKWLSECTGEIIEDK